MKLKNISSRPHWVGDTLIVPGGEGVIAPEWVNAYNKADLVPVVEADEPDEDAPKKRGRPAKVKTDDAA